ncbi:universal stress protein [Longibacter salinarum]|uniref:Universal stress protein n=1 Tax=Longibacter salinarum TaxID=1850348 RepID=A0A2A8CXI6_9BACT|nr:universal stress protein [Longibacter salinarum]PEN13287.1 universal stress protein [Longibacter salinarum]
MFDHVLCACDFSPASERAFGYALDIVERTGASLDLMYVEEIPLGIFQGDPSPAPGEKALQNRFEERCQNDLAPPSSMPSDDRISHITTRSGAVAPALAKYAEANDVDLVVMGTHGRRGVERAIVGSVAEEVLRTAPCPVLTTRALDQNENEASPSPTPIERIVVPIDFSEASRAALQYATRLTSIYDVPLVLVHVVTLPKIPAAYGVELPALSQMELLNRAKSELEKWQDEMVPAGQDASCEVTSGNPVASIHDVASAPGDLLVMSTRGLSGIKRVMLGSVAAGVLRRATGPVISSHSFPSTP